MKFHATVLYVDDVPAALVFYERAFGFKMNHFDEALQYGELDTGNTTLALSSHELGVKLTAGSYARPNDGRTAGVEITFMAPDVRAAFDHAVRAGAQPVKGPEVMPWGWTMAFVRSTDGTLIGLCSAPAVQA